MNRIQLAHHMMFERYHGIIASRAADIPGSGDTGAEHLMWMCIHAQNSLPYWPIDKAARWLGYIQGCLTVHGIVTTGEERDVSRPIFHDAYSSSGQKIPDRAGR